MAETGIGSSPVAQNSAAWTSAFAAFSHLFTANTTAGSDVARAGLAKRQVLFYGPLNCVLNNARLSAAAAMHLRIGCISVRPHASRSPCPPERGTTTWRGGLLALAWLVWVHAPQPGQNLVIYSGGPCLQGRAGGDGQAG